MRHEVEFFDVTKSHRKQRILVGCFQGMWWDMSEHAQSDEISESALSQG